MGWGLTAPFHGQVLRVAGGHSDANSNKSCGAGRRHARRSCRFRQRMERCAAMVEALCLPREALSVDLRQAALRVAGTVGLVLIGLPAWITQLVEAAVR
jgi:hypothetical protein